MAKKKKKKAKKKATRRTTSGRASRAPITVQVARLSQEVQTVTVPNGGTLQDALIAAGFYENDLENMLPTIRLNRRAAVLKCPLKAGDFITVSPRTQGGK